MSVTDLLARAAATSNRREALLLVLVAWREKPCAQLAALACALDMGTETSAHSSTTAFCDEAATRGIAERGSLAWSAGTERTRLEALRSWSPDPRLSAVLEEAAWVPPPGANRDEGPTQDELDWWNTFERLCEDQADPMLQLASEISEYPNGIPARDPPLAILDQYAALPGLSPDDAIHARAIANSHFALGASLAAIYAAPADDRPRVVYADALQEQGDERGEFIIQQCRSGAMQHLAPRRWLGRLGPVLRGTTFGFRRGFLAAATVRFRHQADVELFGSLPEWRTVEHLTWALPGVTPSSRFIGPAMERLMSAHGASFERLMAAPAPWPRLESVTLKLQSAAELLALHASSLFPRLEAVALEWCSLDASWFKALRISRWKRLELNTWWYEYESLIEALEESSLETLRFRECELRRGAKGHFNRIKVRGGEWLGFRHLGPRTISRALPQGYFESSLPAHARIQSRG